MNRAEPTPTYFIGVDLAQRSDFTAVVVNEVTTSEGGERRHSIRHLERFRRVDYPSVVERLRTVAEALAGERALVLDSTGLGNVVLDYVRQARLPCRVLPVTITSGAEVRSEGGSYWTPKRDLVAALALGLETGRVKIAAGLRLAETLRRELENFRVTLSASGHDSYAAGGSGHDDLTVAAALAVWAAEREGSRGPFLFAPVPRLRSSRLGDFY